MLGVTAIYPLKGGIDLTGQIIYQLLETYILHFKFIQSFARIYIIQSVPKKDRYFILTYSLF